jgi:formylglycine-generating enzyme required for sulfatase activity
MPQADVEITANYEEVLEVSNLSVAQRPGTKLVDISYDVFGGGTNAVSVALFITDGTNQVNTMSLSGDAGAGVLSGAGRSMLWDMAADWDGQVADLTFRVMAFESVPVDGMVEIPAGVNSGTNGLEYGESYDADSTSRYAETYSLEMETPLYMDEAGVTKAEWDAVYTWAVANGYGFYSDGDGKGSTHPVVEITWNDAVKWCNARSEMDGKTLCYSVSGAAYKAGWEQSVEVDLTADGYRLPLSDEWEYAARGGLTSTRFPRGNSIYQYGVYGANLIKNGEYHPDYEVGDWPYTSPVKSFPANGYGLYDIDGNASTWCFDTTTANYRVTRGGNWRTDETGSRCGFEPSTYSESEYPEIGLRCVRRLTDGLPSRSASVIHSVDSRNYTLAVSSTLSGEI